MSQTSAADQSRSLVRKKKKGFVRAFLSEAAKDVAKAATLLASKTVSWIPAFFFYEVLPLIFLAPFLIPIFLWYTFEVRYYSNNRYHSLYEWVSLRKRYRLFWTDWYKSLVDRAKAKIE